MGQRFRSLTGWARRFFWMRRRASIGGYDGAAHSADRGRGPAGQRDQAGTRRGRLHGRNRRECGGGGSDNRKRRARSDRPGPRVAGEKRPGTAARDARGGNQTPVLILTARGLLEERVAGLDS